EICFGGCSACFQCASDSDCIAAGAPAGTICVAAGSCCAPLGTTTACLVPCNSCGCFTAGTLIAMADGTSRPIEGVLVGDLVLGNAGRVNRVTEVLLPVLGQRPLYALNGS